jgi:hypothetical protein
VDQVANEETPESTSAPDAGEDGPEDDSEPAHHRLDVGADRIGLSGQSSSTFSLGYTWAPGAHHAVSGTFAFAKSDDLGEAEESNNLVFGDTVVGYSWTGRAQVSAKPWLPSRLGSGVEVAAPTGNVEAGGSADMWVVTPYLGVVRAVGNRAVLLPTIGYGRSFWHGEQAVPIELLTVELGLLVDLSSRWWLFFRPAYWHEFKLSDDITHVQLQVGREVGARNGISLEYGKVSAELTSELLGFRGSSQDRLTLRAHFGFR